VIKKWKFFILIAIFLFVFVFSSFNIFLEKHTFNVNQQNEYVLDCEFEKVKKILVRTDVLEEIISYEQGRLLDKKWNKLVFSSNRPLIDGIDIDARCEFLVLKNDHYLGDLKLRFKQDTHIDKSKIVSRTELMEPVGFMKKLQTEMLVSKKEKQTQFFVKNSIQYERTVPKKMVKEIYNNIENSLKTMLGNNQKVITDLVSKYSNKSFIISAEK
jgi:hypothetical protein